MASSSLEGHTLGKYRVLEPLGRGGMARVYRAYHPQLDRYVAIKVLRSDLVDDEEFLARFRREAQAVAALRHPNIVQVYDFDVQDDVSYMVMELLEGDTLKMRLNDYRVRDEPMPSSPCPGVRWFASCWMYSRGWPMPTVKTWSIETSSRPTSC